MTIKKATIIVEIGMCGFGYTRSSVREVRVGLVRISVFGGSLNALLEKAKRSLGDAVCDLKKDR